MSQIEEIFGRESSNEHVWTVHGYGIQVIVNQGHLTVRDGIGKLRRERKLPRADRTLKRLIITGPDGYVSLSALRWCAEHGITVVTLRPNDELTTAWAPADRSQDAQLIRNQVIAGETATGTEVARELLTRKVRGQAEVILKLTGDLDVYEALERFASQMQTAESTTHMSELEGWAAKEYFTLWQETAYIKWSATDLSRIPENWIGFPGRSSTIAAGRNKYNASNPVNAMLNFAYMLGYSEARTACVACGLDPRLGFIHTDKTGRDSLALDVLEAVRPDIDRYILGLLGHGQEARRFSRRDFTEPPGYVPGSCRLTTVLAHEIAEQSYAWGKPALDAAQAVVSILTGHQGKRGSAMPNWELHKTAFVTQQITIKEIITPKQWETFVPLLPRRKHQRGHPPIDDRIIIAGILHCERHHRPWAHVPTSLGISYRTMRERRRQWQLSGHWPEIKTAIDELARKPR